MTSTPDRVPQRISEADRDEAVQRLQEAFADGHLAREEMDEHLEVALTATTPGELVPVLSSLPEKDTGPAVKISVMAGRIKRRGPWRVPRVLTIESPFGRVDLDLSQAIIEYPSIDIELRLNTGRARITLPRDAVVEFEDLETVWKQPSHKPPRTARKNGPRVRITGSMQFGRLKIRYKRARYKRR
ncbi:DUF1707 SHOCT-like domain-containing protein [Embleya sp. AB8]|uniref:DUF1707 SHOCT-like domain-containing protein n=1 Tax=Embleya sp. AB8 TaxID=3156304 RepID=UPI003C7848B1